MTAMCISTEKFSGHISVDGVVNILFQYLPTSAVIVSAKN